MALLLFLIALVTLSPILGEGNRTINIPTYELDTDGSLMYNGTKTIEYSGEPNIEIPWRNTTITIDVNEYVTCVQDSESRYIQSGNELGTNLSIIGNRPVDILDSTMDTCLMHYYQLP